MRTRSTLGLHPHAKDSPELSGPRAPGVGEDRGCMPDPPRAAHVFSNRDGDLDHQRSSLALRNGGDAKPVYARLEPGHLEFEGNTPGLRRSQGRAHRRTPLRTAVHDVRARRDLPLQTQTSLGFQDDRDGRVVVVRHSHGQRGHPQPVRWPCQPPRQQPAAEYAAARHSDDEGFFHTVGREIRRAPSHPACRSPACERGAPKLNRLISF